MGFFTKKDNYVEIKFSTDRSSLNVMRVENTNGKEITIDRKKSFSMTKEGRFPNELFEYIASITGEFPEKIKIHFNEVTDV
jgi:hypothetical protein